MAGQGLEPSTSRARTLCIPGQVLHYPCGDSFTPIFRLRQSVKLAEGHTARKSRLPGCPPPRPGGDLAAPPPSAAAPPPWALDSLHPELSSVLSHHSPMAPPNWSPAQTSPHARTHALPSPQFFIFFPKPISLSRSPVSPWDLPPMNQKPEDLSPSPFPRSHLHLFPKFLSPLCLEFRPHPCPPGPQPWFSSWPPPSVQPHRGQ